MKFSDKNSDIFVFLLKNIDVGTRYSRLVEAVLTRPQSLILRRNKKNNVYPLFYYINVGFNEVKLYRQVFMMRTDFTTSSTELFTHYAKRQDVNVSYYLE